MHLQKVVESSITQQVVITLIIINAVILGMETYPAVMAEWGSILIGVDSIILTIFVVEILARIVVYRSRFFRDPWSLFDFTVVAIALVPASGPFEVLRALRVLRVLRLLTMVPSMRRVVAGMLRALPGIGSVAAIMLIIFYVSAVIATNLFSQSFPEWFGSLEKSSYTLFQIMTLESWSMGIVRPIMEVHPQAWLFFIPFILVATFTVLNLIMAVIVNAVQDVQQAELTSTEENISSNLDKNTRQLQDEIRHICSEIQELKSMLKDQR